MTAKETLKVIAKQWCDLNDLMALAGIGKNKALTLRNEIKADLLDQGYTLPGKSLPMIEVVNKLKINISYLQKMANQNIG